jgi:hypothetical protein
MNKLHLAIAAALALGAQFASAQVVVPLEGGQAANALAVAPFASTADRASVSAEGREAARRLSSRSGQQTETERAIDTRFTSTRSRDDVRAEAVVSPQVFEGGQAGMLDLHATPAATATVAGGSPATFR